MNRALLQGGCILILAAVTSCNSTSTSNTSATDSTTTGNTTTTTTTTVTHHVYTGKFLPQDNMKYLDLKTQKQVTVRIDTTTGMLVNSETSEPMDLFVAGADTIYGQNGNVANTYIIHDARGNYTVDPNWASSNSDTNPATTTTTDNNTPSETNTSTTDAGAVRGKYKQKANGDIKIKNDQEKIKEKGDKEKIKERY